MKKSIVLCLHCILFLAACSENKGYIFYKNFKKEVLPEITDSFQVQNKSDIMSCYTINCEYPSAIVDIGYCGLTIIFDYSKDTEQFNKIVQHIDSFNLAKISSEEKSLLMINDTSSIKYHTNNSYPIYNIYQYYDIEIEEGVEALSKTNLVYYVFKYKKGIFINDSNIFKKSFKFSEAFYKRVYKHGYCNGATVDKKNKRVVYWTVIW